MGIYAQGQLNLAALTVPGLYVNIVPPQVQLLNGVPTNLGGIVAGASWGPVNSPTIFGGMYDGAMIWGPPKSRKSDMMTCVSLATLQGKAGAFVGVRVTDGTDTAATAFLGQGVGSITLGAAGSGYTSIPVVTISAPQASGGTRATAMAVVGGDGTLQDIRLVSSGSGYTSAPTVTITGGGGTGGTATSALGLAPGLAFWQALAAAINTGAGVPRGPSGIIVATASSSGLAITSKYTGTNGSKTVVSLAAGSALGSFKVVVQMTGALTEQFDNLGAGLYSTNVPAFAVTNLTGGSDGVTGINTFTMLGEDIEPRTGMYALRSTGVSVGTLWECDDINSISTQIAFGLNEGVYMITTGPQGDTVQDVVITKANAGLDSYAFKHMHGDWINFEDTINQAQRKVSPQALILGKLINLSPHLSPLNKPLLGMVSTEKSASNLRYADVEISALYQAGVDVIANPCPGGHYFGCRTGRNGSSNPATHGDNYTRMTNFIAATLDRGMGVYVGEIQSRKENDPTRKRAKATVDAFLTVLATPQLDGTDQPMIDDFQTVVDKSINPDSRIALGYMTLNAKVVYMSVVEFFVINLEGGQTVTIDRVGTFTNSQVNTPAYATLNAPFVTGQPSA